MTATRKQYSPKFEARVAAFHHEICKSGATYWAPWMGSLRICALPMRSFGHHKDVKERQLSFYQAAIAEFRGFNDAWRKHVMHARDW